ncbi:glucodextranase DOMON-like domain-containing protein [Deinococcus detaillensis]|uniref:glucodextranase DOMON-like domain-containing protein n=1 Tax=Deinococcus detaillensis TaxID=2592048 RepID=UPI001CDD27C0|nr:glucodextranase DOMON-like domain-containing protein [Deinococcus detaillensis]
MFSLLAALLLPLPAAAVAPPPALLLSVPDPAGDASGDGSYQLPTRPAISASALDLRLFKAENVSGKLRLSVSFGAIGNPWNAPAGYSGAVLDIFVKTAPGGISDLTGLGLRVAGSSGWQEHYRLDGFQVQHFSAPPQADQAAGQPLRPVLAPDAPRVTLQGTELILDTDLNAGEYSYWVTSSVYSPFSPDGLLRPGGDTSASGLRSAREGTPVPVDVLLSGDQKQVYATGVLPAVGQIRDTRSVILLGLAIAGLLAAAVLSVLAWRRGA